MNPVDTRLQDLLAGGPKLSRDVIAALAAEGFTPKQLRRAREHLGVVVTRNGRGQDMRSSWGLPVEIPEAPNSGDDGSIHAQRSVVRKGQVLGHVVPTVPAAANPSAASLRPFEEDRVARRTSLFVGKGLDITTARQVAVLLVTERDRTGTRGGSCFECQNLRSPRACIAADAGFGQGPRDAAEVWSCSYARLSGP